MAEHSLAIRSFQARIALTGLREHGPPLGREVGRVVRELLPAAIARILAPLLGDRDGVLRIDRIALALRLGRGEISALRLADLLAREIARTIAERAQSGGGSPRIGAGFAFWPDHSGFAAAYLANRLRLMPAPDWAFPDFRPLDHLAPHEAALELLSARPTIVAALARLLGPYAAPALAARMPESTAALLIARLVDGLQAEMPIDAETDLTQMLAILPDAVEGEPARAAVAVAITTLSHRPPPEPDAVRRVVMLARLAVALAALRSTALADRGRPPDARDLAPDMLVHLPAPVRSVASAAVAPLTGNESVRASLARLLSRADRRTNATPSTPPPPPDRVAQLRTITSRLAGIGLLMPAALEHGLPEHLSPGALNRTLAAAAGPELESAARLDPLLAALAPFDPRERSPSFPPVPYALRAVVPEAQRQGAAEGEGAAGWAACLVHAFAAGLSGLEASSLAYLREQFLVRPGTLHVADEQLTLVLDPLPLSIVLRLSGVHGWCARLSQAKGSLLRIEIKES